MWFRFMSAVSMLLCLSAAGSALTYDYPISDRLTLSFEFRNEGNWGTVAVKEGRNRSPIAEGRIAMVPVKRGDRTFFPSSVALEEYPQDRFLTMFKMGDRNWGDTYFVFRDGNRVAVPRTSWRKISTSYHVHRQAGYLFVSFQESDERVGETYLIRLRGFGREVKRINYRFIDVSEVTLGDDGTVYLSGERGILNVESFDSLRSLSALPGSGSEWREKGKFAVHNPALGVTKLVPESFLRDPELARQRGEQVPDGVFLTFHHVKNQWQPDFLFLPMDRDTTLPPLPAKSGPVAVWNRLGDEAPFYVFEDVAKVSVEAIRDKVVSYRQSSCGAALSEAWLAKH